MDLTITFSVDGYKDEAEKQRQRGREAEKERLREEAQHRNGAVVATRA